jgi:argininosuccinate lyase
MEVDMIKKIWGDYELHPLIEKFTKGDDLELDAMLLPYDIAATKAHAAMLQFIGCVSVAELDGLNKALKAILKTAKSTNFSIPAEYEDGHSYLEAKLTEMCGDAGKKIHFLRSRNDQSLTMIRLYMKDKLLSVSSLSDTLEAVLLGKVSMFGGIAMPGYTHQQKAMPTTVDTWLASYAHAVKDAKQTIKAISKLIDQNPLGSGAGFGFIGQGVQPDTAITTKLLGFANTQQNPMYSGMSRGYFELLVLQAVHPLVLLVSQFSSDMLLYTMSEFGFMSLPKQFTTGSSIMPQKHNYDCLEVLRGNESIFWGYIEQIHGVTAKKTSGYQRDLQLTKKPFIEAMQLACDMLSIWILIAENIEINQEKIQKALTPDLYATAKVNDLVMQGMNFRDAYLTIKNEMEKQL